MRTLHLVALTSSRLNGRNVHRAVRASLGMTLAAVLAVAGLVAVAAPAAADTAPPQGFTTQEAPLPSDAGNGSTNPMVYTASSDCAAQNSCVVVGWHFDSATPTQHTWGDIWTQNGTSWSNTEAPEPSNAGTGTNQGMWIGSQGCGVTSPCHAVSCPHVGFCIWVGQYTDNAGHTQPVVGLGYGATWSVFQAPVPSDAQTSPPFAYLRSVTCVSATDCWAAGGYRNNAGFNAPLLVFYNGSTLTGETAPAPSDINTTSPGMFVATLSCSSATSCAADGSYNSTNGTKGLLLSLSGGPTATWTSMGAPEPADANTGSTPFATLYDIKCTSWTCIGVGTYQNTLGNAGWIVTGSGTSWTPMAAPLPSNAGTGGNESANLLGVSCGGPWVCTGVGSYRDLNGRIQGLIVQNNGGATWTATQAPQPSDAASPTSQDATLESVSCPSPAFCMAVGFYVNQAAIGLPLIETYSKWSWSAMTAPLPSNSTASASQSAIAKAVACFSLVSCAIGGWYPDPGLQQGFLDTYTGLQGYWLTASDGGVFTYGNAQFYGSAGSLHLNAPVVGMAATADGQGYWSVASDGGIFNYGDAGFFGSRGGQPLNKPIVGMAATPDGKGYWLVASDGGIFTYGNASFFGSAGSLRLNKPVVGMAATPDGGGYWLVATDGGIFNYGDAAFYGSTGSLVLNKPVVGMAATPDGLGYWLVASDGGIFNYGDAAFYGSTGSLVLNKPVVGMAASPSGKGYWFVASDGGVFNYGDAPFYGSAGSLVLNKPVVAMAG